MFATNDAYVQVGPLAGNREDRRTPISAHLHYRRS
jgi:hypothetical protein